MKKVKTIFVKATTKSNSVFSSNRYQINGDQSTRDIQAAIDEMEIDGYHLSNSQTFTSSSNYRSWTEGTLLYFTLIDKLET